MRNSIMHEAFLGMMNKMLSRLELCVTFYLLMIYKLCKDMFLFSEEDVGEYNTTFREYFFDV